MSINNDQLAICNYALGLIGEVRITDIDDQYEANARRCKQFYGQALDIVFRQHRWNCLMKRASLSASTIPPIFGWSTAYPLPSDCVRLCTINERSAWESEDFFDIEQRQILTNETSCNLRYVAYIEDPSVWDSLLTQCVYTKLAELLARVMTGSDQIASQMVKKYEFLLNQASVVDARESRSKENRPLENILCNSSLIASRYNRISGSSSSGIYEEPFISRDPASTPPPNYYPAMKQAYPIPENTSQFTITPPAGIPASRLESLSVKRLSGNGIVNVTNWSIATDGVGIVIDLDMVASNSNTHELIVNFTN